MYPKMFTDDKLHEECGVFGICTSADEDVASSIYYSLYALQHRGQESAGIAVSNEGKIDHYKGMGLVPEVFNDEILNKLKGSIGIGHVRYSTSGESYLMNAQPLVATYKKGAVAIAHNGNLTNADAIRDILEEQGTIFQTTSDTEVIANLLARNNKEGIVKSIKKVTEILKGSYALVIISNDMLIGARDPFGLRPLCIGKTENSYMLASESCALDTLGAEYVRDVEPGEIVVIDKKGMKSVKSDKWCKKNLCVFELIYFSRPDSKIDDTNVYLFRSKSGKILAEESPVDADVVISVPDSGTPAAIGYAEASGIPYGVGLIKNKYIGRTFIQPSQELREKGVKIKLNALKENIEGKRVIMVDDSIVRGTTMKKLVDMLKKAGAKEVHVRVSSPPVTNPCYFGIDTPYRSQLVGATKTVDEIKEMIGADSLAYLSIEGLMKATGQTKGFCKACFDGDYPMEVPINRD